MRISRFDFAMNIFYLTAMFVLVNATTKNDNVRCPDYNMDYYGYDIELHYTQSWEKCGYFCQLNAHCKYWTWRKDNHACWLKSDNEGITNNNENTISGSNPCPQFIA